MRRRSEPERACACGLRFRPVRARTALHGAARRGHAEVAKLLVQAHGRRRAPRRVQSALHKPVDGLRGYPLAGRSLRGHRRLAGLLVSLSACG